MSLKGILHKEYENILKICLVFATIVYNLLIFNVNYFRRSEVKETDRIKIKDSTIELLSYYLFCFTLYFKKIDYSNAIFSERIKRYNVT